MHRGTNGKVTRAHGVVAAAVGAVTTALLAPMVSATVVTTDAFNYTPGDRLVGQTNPGTLKVWGDPPSPTQPAGAADLQRIQSGSLSYPGLTPATGNSFLIPNDTNSNIARLDFPAEQNITTAPGGLFYSFTMKLTSFTSLPAGTGTNQAGSAAVQNGAFVAGFFWGSNAGPPAGGNGMSVATSYGAQFRIRREVDANNAETGRYQLGIIKNNQTPAVGSVQYAWDTTHSYAVGETLLITASYKWNGAYAGAGQTDDETFLWVNGVPGDLQPAPTVTGPTGTGTVDMYASNSNRAQSFWFRSDGVQLGNLLVDELRIGQSYAEVTPSAPRYYWDIDGTNPGAGGGTAPSGLWDGTATNFNTDSNGGAGTLVAAPTADDIVYFAAGNGATGSYTVNVSGTRSAAVAHFKDGTIALNGGTVAIGVFDVAAGSSASVSSVVTGYASGSGNVIKSGEGTLTLSGANTYTGGTLVNGGTLTALGASALGATTNSLTVNNPSTAAGPSVLVNLSTTAPTTVGTLSGSISNAANSATINNGGQLFTVNQAALGVFAGTITGAGGLTKGGSATLALTGTNTYGGPTSVAAGTLRVSKPGALPGYNAPGSVSVASGATLTVNAGGASEWAAADIDALRGAAAFPTGSTLGIDTGGGNFTYSSAMAGQHAVLKSGVNTLTLAAANSYAGDTTVSAGTLAYGVANAIPSGAGAGNVYVAGTLDLNGTTSTINALNGPTTGTGAALGTVDTVAGGTASLSVGATDQNGLFAGVIKNTAGTLALNKVGAGVQTLSGANTYTGGTTITAGTLQLGNGGTTGSITGNITNNGALVVNRSNAVTLAGAISGSGSVTQSGAGTTTLSGNNTHAGGVNVNAGTLIAASSTALGTGTTSVGNGANAQAQAGLSTALTLGALQTTGSGKFDLTNNSMVIKGMADSAVRTQLQAGYNAGAWNGASGIVSTGITPETSIGYATKLQTGITDFKGVTGMADTDVQVKFTYAGDANLDGKVDIGDLGLLAGAWQAASGKVWFDGDFTYDGAVDIGDLGLLSGNWQKGTAGNPNPPLMDFATAMAQFSAFDGVVVPEPTGLGLLALAGAGLLAGRRRRA